MQNLNREIVKIQVPLNQPDAPAYMYNKDRSFEKLCHVHCVQTLMNGAPKAYFYATFEDGKLALEPAPWQEW